MQVADVSQRARRHARGLRCVRRGLLGLAFPPKWQTNHTVYLSFTPASGTAAAGLQVLPRARAPPRPTARLRRRARADAAQPRSAVREPQRRQHRFGPDGFLYIGFGDGGSGGDPPAIARRTRRAVRQDAAHRRRRTDGKPTRIPPTTRSPSGGGRRRRSSPTACATRGAGASTAPPATCGSATSARTRGRRSTTSQTAATTAGTSAKARTATTRRRQQPDAGRATAWRTPPSSTTRTTIRKAATRSPAATSIAARPCPTLVGSYCLRRRGQGGLRARLRRHRQAGSRSLLETGGNIVVVRRGSGRRALRRQLRRGTICSWRRRARRRPTPSRRRSRRPAASIPRDRARRRRRLIPYDVNTRAVVRRRRQAALDRAARRRADPRRRRRRLGLPDRHRADEGVLGRRQARRDAPARAPPRRRLGGLQLRVARRRSDATLLPAGKTKRLGAQSWTYPSRTDCLRCHTQAAGRTLGLETLQVNSDAGGNSGMSWNCIRWIGPSTRRSAPSRAACSTVAARSTTSTCRSISARAYLHSNCGFCHRMGGTAQFPPDWRCPLTLAEPGACNATPAQRRYRPRGREGHRPRRSPISR